MKIKSFVSLKNESFVFWTRVHFKEEGSQVLQNFKGVAHKEGGGGRGGLTADRFRILLGVLGKKG